MLKSEGWILFWSFLGMGIWGFLTSAMLFNYVFPAMDGVLVPTIVGLAFAGSPVAACYVYKCKREYEPFSVGTFLFGWLSAGVYSTFLGSVLQFFLLVLGLRNVFGLSIERLFWHFPDWLFGQ
jgi:hypothetical protein